MMSFYENALEADPGLVRRGVDDRQRLLGYETYDFLRELIFEYPKRQEQYWERDYSSEEAYLESVEPNRQRWLEAVGDFGPPDEDMAPEVEPFAENDYFKAEWVTITLYGKLRGRGVIGIPKEGSPPYPVIICQHGLGGSPEKTFGLGDEGDLNQSYAQRCLEAGFAVLSPMNTSDGPPAQYTRMALMLGKTLWGLQIAKISRLIDYCETREELDTSRLGMWGISVGGAYTSFTPPLEPRIKAAIICAWFNHRLNKMVVQDPRHSCFLHNTNAEYVFVPGWLREFTDSDLISLICPRPVMSQTGKCDAISWWPWVVEEFEATRKHYEKLGIADRLVLDLHEGGHEIRVATGLEFMRKWL